MLKFAFYLGLSIVGFMGTLVNPCIGAASCILAYLFNPVALAIDNHGIRYQLWLTAAFIVSVVIHRAAGLPKVGREGRVPMALWAFVAVATLTSLWAVHSSEQALTGVYELFKTALTATLLIRVVKTERDVRMIVLACLVGGLHAAFMQVLGPRFGYMPTADPKEAVPLPDPLAPVMVLLLPVACLVAINGRRLERWIAICAVPVLVDGLIVTYERAALMGFAAEIPLLLFFLPRRIVVRAGPAVLLAGVLLFWRFAPSDYWERAATILHPTEEGSAASRFVINQASWAMFSDYPFGVGYNNYPDVSPRYLAAGYLTEGRRSAHNMYFTILCETGFPGVLLWLMSFGGALWLLRRVRKNRRGRSPTPVEVYAMGAEIGLYGWLVVGWTQSFHEVDPAFWFLALAVVITRIQHKQMAEPEKACDPALDGNDATEEVLA